MHLILCPIDSIVISGVCCPMYRLLSNHADAACRHLLCTGSAGWGCPDPSCMCAHVHLPSLQFAKLKTELAWRLATLSTCVDVGPRHDRYG